MLFLVREDPDLKSDDVIASCKAQFVGYKMPRVVEFRDSLPKTHVGKIPALRAAGGGDAGKSRTLIVR